MTFTFIGMPGAGKSCMGLSVAKKLHMALIDTDRLIEKEVGMKLQAIIDERGLSEFKRIEEETLLSITADRTIISTGGSAIYYERAMEHLKSLGPVIYLYTSLDTVIRRIGDFSARGVALAPGQTLEALYAERTALYKKYADITVDCDDDNFMEHKRLIVNAICRRIASYEGARRREKNK